VRSTQFHPLLVALSGRLEEVRRLTRQLDDIAVPGDKRRLPFAELEAAAELVTMLEGIGEPLRRALQAVDHVATNTPDERIVAVRTGTHRARTRLLVAAKEAPR